MGTEHREGSRKQQQIGKRKEIQVMVLVDVGFISGMVAKIWSPTGLADVQCLGSNSLERHTGQNG